MKTLAPSVLSVGLLASLISIAAAQQSIYNLNINSALSNIGPNGGTVTFTYTLASGDPVPGLGTSFTLDYTWSPFSVSGHQWSGVANTSSGRWGILVQLDSFDDPSLLPANNRQEETVSGFVPGNTSTQNRAFIDLIEDGKIDLVGTFSISSEAAPEVPGYQITDDRVRVGASVYSRWLNSDNQQWGGGVWAGPRDNWDLSMPSTYSHGETILYDYTVFTDGLDSFTPATVPVRLGTLVSASITYEPVPVPEPSGMMLSGLAGACALLSRRRRV